MEPIRPIPNNQNDTPDNNDFALPEKEEYSPGAFNDKPIREIPKDFSVTTEDEDDGKEFIVAYLLSYFLGMFGADRFYVGHIWLGILKLLTFGGLSIWAFIDIILILTGSMRDKENRRLKNRQKYLLLAWLMFLAAVGIGVASALLASSAKR